MARKPGPQSRGEPARGEPARGEPSDGERALIEAAMRLAAEKGWRRLTMRDIAIGAGLSLSQAYALAPSKTAILRLMMRRIDAAVLDGTPDDLHADSPRDRVFDVVMRRFEALTPYKAGFAAVMRDSACDPVAMACLSPQIRRSGAWMLEAAGLGADGLRGFVRFKGLLAIFACVVRTWLDDDSEDLGPTMAALDRCLGRAERIIGLCDCMPGRRRDGAGGRTQPAAGPA